MVSKECSTCMFSLQEDENLDDDYMNCHRNPPTVISSEQTVWPTVHMKDWCGAWEAFSE